MHNTEVKQQQRSVWETNRLLALSSSAETQNKLGGATRTLRSVPELDYVIIQKKKNYLVNTENRSYLFICFIKKKNLPLPAGSESSSLISCTHMHTHSVAVTQRNTALI